MTSLNYGEINQHTDRISKIKPFVNNYKWDKTKYLSKIDDQNTFEKNNSTVARNFLYTKEMDIC